MSMICADGRVDGGAPKTSMGAHSESLAVSPSLPVLVCVWCPCAVCVWCRLPQCVGTIKYSIRDAAPSLVTLVELMTSRRLFLKTSSAAPGADVLHRRCTWCCAQAARCSCSAQRSLEDAQQYA